MNKKIAILGCGGFGTLAATRKLLEIAKTKHSDQNIQVPKKFGDEMIKSCEETSEAIKKLSLALEKIQKEQQSTHSQIKIS